MPPRDPADRDDLPMDDDELDLRALRGEIADDRGLGRLGDVARSLDADDLVRDEPPPSVWEGILARTGGRVDDRPAAGDVSPADLPPADVPPADVPPTDVPSPAPDESPAAPPLRPIEGGRTDTTAAPVTRRPWWLAAAAAAIVVVLVVAGGVALLRDGDDTPPVVASARLEPLSDEPTGQAAAVTADLVESDDGLRLDLPTSGLPAPDGFYEVWLIDTNVEGMVSLGPARADGTYDLPAGVDPAAFPVVDVSIEPADGDPTHSGVSVLRGTLA